MGYVTAASCDSCKKLVELQPVGSSWDRLPAEWQVHIREDGHVDMWCSMACMTGMEVNGT